MTHDGGRRAGPRLLATLVLSGALMLPAMFVPCLVRGEGAAGPEIGVAWAQEVAETQTSDLAADANLIADADVKAADSESTSAEAVSPEAISPESADSEAVDPLATNPIADDPMSADPAVVVAGGEASEGDSGHGGTADGDTENIPYWDITSESAGDSTPAEDPVPSDGPASTDGPASADDSALAGDPEPSITPAPADDEPVADPEAVVDEASEAETSDGAASTSSAASADADAATADIPAADASEAGVSEAVATDAADSVSADASEADASAAETADAALADSKNPHGTWGSCQWEITSNGTLVIGPGKGADNTDWDMAPWSSNRPSIKSVVFQDGVILPANISYLFYDCQALESIDFSGVDSGYLSDMSFLFYSCTSLKSVRFADLETSGVQSMYYMFYNCSSLESLNLNMWDTLPVTNMGYMFAKCSSLTTLGVSTWDTSGLEFTFGMFDGCSSLTTLDVSNWDLSYVISAGSMFSGCSSLTSIDVSNWGMESLVDGVHLFYGCTSLTSLDLSAWDTSTVTSIKNMFYGCTSLTSVNVSGWDTSKMTNMEGVFNGCSSLTTLDLSSWDTRNVKVGGQSSWTPAKEMFNGCSSLAEIKVGENFTFTKLTRLPQDVVNGHADWFSLADQCWYNADMLFSARANGGLADTYTKRECYDLTGARVDFEGANCVYNGKPWEPVPTVTLGERVLSPGTDFQVSYENNVDTGKANATVRGVGSFVGTVEATFEIAKADFAGATITLPSTSYEYTGKPIILMPIVKIGGETLAPGLDYVMTYTDNTDIGTATLRISARRNYTGYKDVHFTIKAAHVKVDLAKATVTVSPATLTYDGTARRPKVTVKVGGKTLREDTDYELAWTGGPTFGKLTARVTGEGDYTGSKTATARINFTDTPTDAWYQEQGWLDYVVNGGVMTGLKNARGFTGAFAPEATVTRAQVAVVLFRYANPDSEATSNPARYGKVSRFRDVPAGQWHTAAIEWCAQNGIVTGYGTTGNFGPDDPVTREQLATMMWRFARSQGANGAASASTLSKAPDAGAVSGWARDAAAWCAANRVITGYAQDGRIDPQGSATRAQLAKIITVVTRDVL